MLQALTPCVQDHQSTDVSAEPLGVGSDLAKRVSGGLKQEVVHHALVGERQARKGLRHREDDVDIPDGQQFLLAGRHPGVPRRGETLRAMPVAAAVVREGRLRALFTAIAVAAEGGGATLRDCAEDTSMRARDPGRVGLQKAIAMLAHDVGHLEGWPRHRLCFSRVRRAVSGPEIVSASRGLATACRCFCDRWR